MLPALIPYIPTIVSGVSSYISGRNQESATRKAYENALKQQELERERTSSQLEYEQGLADRQIGESAAASGMSGTPVGRRLSDVEGAKQQAMRQLYSRQSAERLGWDEQMKQSGKEKKRAIYAGIGNILGQSLSSYFNPAKSIGNADDALKPLAIKAPSIEGMYAKTPFAQPGIKSQRLDYKKQFVLGPDMNNFFK